MRAIWTGAIGFGLVNIPVKIYSATEESNLNLDMLDKKDLSHIKFKRVNETSGKEVAWENIVKAYDLDGKYVILDDKDFEKASPEKSKILSIEQFVKADEIDSVYYETPYFLEPQKSGEQAYALMYDALTKTKTVGLGTFILRNKQLLGVIRPYANNTLILNRIRFAEEIRTADELTIPKKRTVKPAELKMAVALIQQLTGKFDIKSYKDTYSSELMKIIRAKAKGKKIAAPKLKIVHSTAKDLMQQLKASLGEKKTTRKKAG